MVGTNGVNTGKMQTFLDKVSPDRRLGSTKQLVHIICSLLQIGMPLWPHNVVQCTVIPESPGPTDLTEQ